MESYNDQISTLKTALENPLSLQPSMQIKFHILLEDGKGHFMTTLDHEPLQYILDGQRIVEADEKEFQHPLKKDILKILVNCTRVGDGNMTNVIVPFNAETGNYDWETKMFTIGKSNLWVRIFEADSVRVAETKAVHANLSVFGRTYVYWLKQKRAICSDLEVLAQSDEYWKRALAFVNEKVTETGEKLTEAYRAWMKIE